MMWSDVLDIRIGALVTTNVLGLIGNSWVANIDSVMHLLVSAGQVGVAIVTILYVIKKIKNLPKKPPEDED